MVILGIDPGTRRMGFGIVEKDGGRARFIDAGLLNISGASTEPGALREAKIHVDALIKKHAPDALAIERLYFSKNQKTAIAVAQARGVVLLAADEAGLPVIEYAPTEIKSGVAGYGNADKKAMLKMVRLVLNEPALSVIDDAVDALAAAIMATQDRTLML